MIKLIFKILKKMRIKFVRLMRRYSVKLGFNGDVIFEGGGEIQAD